MGKKRRVLRSPKFKHLRSHSKFKLLVSENLAEKVEKTTPETVVEALTPKVLTPEPEIIEVEAKKPKTVKTVVVSNDEVEVKPKTTKKRKSRARKKTTTKVR